MGYPSDLLSSRAVVKPGMYAIIPPEGRVFNVIPGIEGCRMTILCTPKMGAGFVQHIGTALPGRRDLHTLRRVRPDRNLYLRA